MMMIPTAMTVKIAIIVKMAMLVKLTVTLTVHCLIQERLGSSVTRVVGYGHVGDGNMHLNITTPQYSQVTWVTSLSPQHRQREAKRLILKDLI